MRRLWVFLLLVLMLACLAGCEKQPVKPKLGVSFGGSSALRWAKERDFMVERAEELDIELLVRFNVNDKPKTQMQDCFELIDSGINVLILMPRDVHQLDDILEYAKKRNVKVVAYARASLNENIDLYIGYDTYKIGQSMGKHLTEKAYKGKYIILKGDPNDFNTPPLYTGAMKYIEPLAKNGDIIILADTFVKKWSAEEATRIVKETLAANNNDVDAILACNDSLARGARIALDEMGVTKPVLISGMDADLDAVQRIWAGTQEMTIYMNLQNMAHTAINEAYHIVSKKEVSINSELKGDGVSKIDAFLVNGQVVTRENLEKVLIDTGVFTREEVYGK